MFVQIIKGYVLFKEEVIAKMPKGGVIKKIPQG
jgi:hypothetical protein